jgi:outer membrane protein assembly factor BamB
MHPAGDALRALAVDRGVGPPTTLVTVSGSGFGAREAVDLSVDGGLAALLAAGPDGRFVGARVQIPASAEPGRHRVTALGRRSGEAVEASFLVRTDWPSARGDALQTGCNPFENVIGTGNVGRLQPRFMVPVGGGESTPVVAGGLVFVADRLGKVTAADARTGAPVWAYWTRSPFLNSPAVHGGLICVGGGDGRVHVLNAATGAPRWAHRAGGPIHGALSVADGLVWFGSADGIVHGFDQATGARRWSFDAGAPVTGSPVVSSNAVYAVTGDGSVHAVDRAAGGVRWTFRTGGTINDSPALSRGILFVGTTDALYAIDARTGAQRWKDAGRAIAGSPAVAGGLVYTIGLDGSVLAQDAGYGFGRWVVDMAPSATASPSVANGVVYVPGRDGTFAALDARSGRRLLTVAGGTVLTYTSPAIADGMVYVGGTDGQLYGLALPD